MTTRYGSTILLLGALCGACDSPAAPAADPLDPAASALAQAPAHVAASGTFTQTGINSLDARTAGANTILEQTSEGTITGTLAGTFEDRLRVIVHPDGRFTAKFAISCTCTVQGRTGVLELVASDTGELASPNVGTFSGRAVITGGTGDLSGVRGVLQIAGTVDVQTGLSTYGYSGTIRVRP